VIPDDEDCMIAADLILYTSPLDAALQQSTTGQSQPAPTSTGGQKTPPVGTSTTSAVKAATTPKPGEATAKKVNSDQTVA